MHPEAKRYWVKTISLTGLLVGAVTAGAFFLAPLTWPLGFLIWLYGIGGGGVLLFTRWHVRNTAFTCPRCRHAFRVSGLTDLWSVNFLGKQFLRCPACGHRSFCTARSTGEIMAVIGGADRPARWAFYATLALILGLLAMGSLVLVGSYPVASKG